MDNTLSYRIARDHSEFAKAKNDKEFMDWLRKFEPAWEREFWMKDIVQMYLSFLAGKWSVEPEEYRDCPTKMDVCCECGVDVYVEAPTDDPIYCTNCF